jgi:hypothetical protein
MKSWFILLLSIFLASANLLIADVPPEAGFVRQSVSLTLETSQDLSSYRFFLESAVAIEEVTVKKGEKTVISPAGHAGAARVVSLLAIPSQSFAKFGGELKSGSSPDLKKIIDERGIEGIVKLMSHDFQTTIREADRGSWADPVYKIEKNNAGLSAILVTGDNASERPRTSPYSNEPKSQTFWAAVAIGAFLTLAFICIGASLLRRSRTKASEADIQE